MVLQLYDKYAIFSLLTIRLTCTRTNARTHVHCIVAGLSKASVCVAVNVSNQMDIHV